MSGLRSKDALYEHMARDILSLTPATLQTSETDTLEMLRLRSAQSDAALTHLPHGLCMFDASRRLILCNPAYVKLYELPARLVIAGTPLEQILRYRDLIQNAPLRLDTYFDVVHQALQSGQFARTRIQLQDGRTIQITHNPMPDGGYVAIHEDISNQVSDEERIRYLAAHDHLTGLSNRSSFVERIDNRIRQIRRNQGLAVHCLDLDQFKAVNDTLGHPMGDLLLKLVTERFLGCIREEDTVARLGGDEFGVLQPGLSKRVYAGVLASRFIQQIGVPYNLEGTEVTIGVSIGIAFWPDHGSSTETLLNCADEALYRAKQAGKNCFCFFQSDPGMA